MPLSTILGISKDYTRPPPGLAWRSSTGFIVTTIGVGLFTDLFLYGLMVPILPFLLADRLGLPPSATQSSVSLLLAAYAGASVLFSPVAGIVADRANSRQLPFLLGLALLLLGSLGLYLGRSMPALLVARVLQGLSASVVWTVGLALCLDTVGPENLGKTVGTVFSATSVGELMAPVLGGVLYEKAGYGAVFGLSAGLLVLDFAMRVCVVEKRVAHRYLAEQGKLAAAQNGNGEEQHAGSEEQERGENREGAEDGSDEVQPLLGDGRNQEFKIPEERGWLGRKVPIIYCFRNSSLLAAQLVAFVQALLLGVIDSTVATHAEDILGFDSLKSGLLFLPIGVANAILGPVGGWAVDRYGTKPSSVFGYAFLVPVLVALRAVTHNSQEQLVLYCVLLGLTGVGLAAIGAPSIVEAGSVVQRYYKANPDVFGDNGPYAQLYGVNSLVFNLGLTVGPLAAGRLREEIGYGNMNAVVAAICLVTAVLCFLYIGGPPRWRTHK